MPDKYIDTTPYWTTSSTFPPFVKLAEDAETDVVVVGGGITGLTTAYLLVKAGKRVVVLERGRCAMTDTGHTSAHLTMVTDTRISELVKRFGRNHAQAVWDAGLAAIATIDETVREHDIAAVRMGRRLLACALPGREHARRRAPSRRCRRRSRARVRSRVRGVGSAC